MSKQTTSRHGICCSSAQQNRSVRVQLPTSADNVTLPAFAAVRRAAAQLLLSAVQQSIGISCPPGAQQQTRTSRVRLASDGTDRRTDRQTDIRSFHRPCSAYSAGSAKHYM